MQRGRSIALIGAIVILLAVLIYGSMSVVQAECELCVEFQGRTVCRRGSGENEEAARDAAQRAACAVLAVGMDQSIGCSRRPPTNVQCPPSR